MSEDDIFNTCIHQHSRRDLTCVCTFFFKVHVLSCQPAMFVPLHSFNYRNDVDSRYTEYYVNIIVLLPAVSRSQPDATASLGVMFIFQLPAIIFFLAMINRSPIEILMFSGAGKTGSHILNSVFVVSCCYAR